MLESLIIAGVFLWIVKSFNNSYFEELLQVAVNTDSK